MYGVENRFKMQLLLGLKGSPLVGVGITNFVTPDLQREGRVQRGVGGVREVGEDLPRAGGRGDGEDLPRAGGKVRCDKIEYCSTDQWGSFKAQQKLHFKAVFHAVRRRPTQF